MTTATIQSSEASPKTSAPSPRSLRRVVVLGANGTMGYQTGALFASAGLEVVFLARTREKAMEGRAGACRAVRSSTLGEMIMTGSYDEDLASAVADADLVFEAMAENFEVKAGIFAQVDRYRRPGALVASVTSGLSITALAEPRSEDFKRNFCGLHFFNPPQVIVGTEIIAGKHTHPSVIEFLENFCTERLGRVMIRTADTPGFAGNRVGFKVLNEVAQLAERINPLLLDRVVGPYTGRAMSPLATIDLVGWDVHRAIVDNVFENTSDEARDTLRLPAYMVRLIEQGVLGSKSGGGFFRRVNDQKCVLDVATGEYRPVKEVRLPDLKFINDIAFLHRVGQYRAAMELFARAEGDEAALARRVIAGYIAYAFHRVGEVTESITGIDLIMGAGFNWAPPSVLVDTLGLRATVRMIEQAGLAVPPLLEDSLRRNGTHRLFTDPRFNIGKFFVAR